MYAVILAGGGGTRLWPLSDPRHPKPFLPLFPDGASLLQRTVARLMSGDEIALTLDDIHVVTDRRYGSMVSDQTDVGVIAEPRGRNTAAAIALAATSIERDPDEVMVVLPADHLVQRDGVFRAVLADAERELAGGAFGIESPIVTLGATPTGPSTQYGYLVPDPTRQQGHPNNLHSYALSRFVEKPDATKATELLAIPDVCWNAGIFMARRRAWLGALEKHTRLVAPLANTRDSETRLEAAYAQIEPISIDYAVMEPAAADGQVVMAALDVGWSDVGTWTALLDALVGGYAAPARVIPPGETAHLAGDDLAVTRDVEDRLVLEAGPREIDSSQPIGFLPDARQHTIVVQDLLARVNDATSATVKVSA